MKKEFIENSSSFFKWYVLSKEIFLHINVLFVRVYLHAVLILITQNYV